MGARGRIDVPALESDQLRQLLVAVADVIIMLDDNYVVVGATDPMKIDNVTLLRWTGRRLVDLVAPESVEKISGMLREDSRAAQSSDRWRHVNFLDAAGRNLPLLVKYFELATGPVTTRLLVGRDLRPVQEAQKRVQRALADLDARHGARRRAQHALDASVDLNELIGRKPFDEIVVEATGILARAFFSEALKRTGGDRSAAARLLGLPESDFLERLAKFGLA